MTIPKIGKATVNGMTKKVNFDEPIYMNFPLTLSSKRVYCAKDRYSPFKSFPFTMLKETSDGDGRPYFKIYTANEEGFVRELESVSVTNEPLFRVR
jgi:hypothetical protein